jgi:Ca2+-binding EF-hand superfamily protein
MKTKTYLLALSSILALSTFASAQSDERGKGNRPDPIERFKAIDTNGDGTLSKDEVRGRMAERFDDLDADSDGQITPEELKAGREGMPDRERPNPGERFAELDTDGSGSLSIEEVKAGKDSRMAKAFSKIDTDNDGELSKEELKAVGDRMRERGPKGGDEEGKPGKGGLKKAK